MTKAGIDTSVYKPYSVSFAPGHYENCRPELGCYLLQGSLIKRLSQVHPFVPVFCVTNKSWLIHDSCATGSLDISCDFVVRMMVRQNQKLNETYLIKSKFDWDSAESSVAQSH